MIWNIATDNFCLMYVNYAVWKVDKIERQVIPCPFPFFNNEFTKVKYDRLLLGHPIVSPPANAYSNIVNALNHSILKTISQGGSILIPLSFDCSIVLDIIECIAATLLSCQNIPETPILLVGPLAERCLTLAGVSGEWLNKSRRNRVENSKDPFPFSYLKKSGVLRVRYWLSHFFKAGL